ncbi:hypothetical protein D3C71_1359310 [compost metagenome]
MVETAQQRNRRQRRPTAGTDQHRRALDATRSQQRLQNHDMVFAVAVVVVEDALRGVRLQSAVAEVHRYVADVLRHPAVQHGGLLAAIGDATGELVGQRLDLRRDSGGLATLELVGLRHLRPVTVRTGHDGGAVLPRGGGPVLRLQRIRAPVRPFPARHAIAHTRHLAALHAPLLHLHGQIGRRAQGHAGIVVLGEYAEGFP